MFKYNNLYDNLRVIHTEYYMPNIQSFVRKTAFILSVLLLTSLVSASYAANEQRYYDIEIVLFQHSASLKGLPELKDAPQHLEMPERYIQLGMPVTTENTGYLADYYFRLLPNSEHRLNDAAEKIANSNNYRIIKHFAWRQPGLDKSIALPVFIQDSIDPEIPEVNNNNDQPTPPLYTQAKLEGLIKVSLSRYLHLETELHFEASGIPPLPEPLVEAPIAEEIPVVKPRPTTAVYYEKQKRRMRSKELHYIDHPIFGMLVLMTQAEVPEKIIGPTSKIKK